MFTANVYKIMIGCPGDIQNEVNTAKAVINRWTNVHAEQNGTVLIPINWNTNSYPEHGTHPQKIINKQLTTKSDMLIGIFGGKIGSPTDTAQSGTIEEIEEHIKAEKPVMLFFRQLNDTSLISPEDISMLEAFKQSIKNRCLYREYRDANIFEKVFTDALDLFLANNWLMDKPSLVQEEKMIQFSKDEIVVMQKWVASDNNTAFILGVLGGKIFVLGDSQYSVESGREEAEWNDFFERLETAGFIKYVRTNNQGSPVYDLQKLAYEKFDLKR